MKITKIELYHVSIPLRETFWPTWIPGTDRIAYTAPHEDCNGIWAMNADGSGITRITFHEAQDGEPSWR